ncbi:MAG: type III pantothenate kinase [Eubacteriaceae bacterium]|nr:type III pantothenate kinase [Eubacteriaceae bacterium]
MALLAIDIGNTTTEFVVFAGQTPSERFKMITKESRTPDEIALFISQMASLRGVNITDVNACIISSVVPEANSPLQNAVSDLLKTNPVFVSHELDTGISLIGPNPEQIGADRIVDASAAMALYGCPIVVVNFGTATRYDYVNADGVFCAAITSPGLQACAEALFGKASLLPLVKIEKPPTIMASDTITSIQAGLVYAHIGQTEYILKEMRKEAGVDFKAVACGGYADTILPHTGCIDIHDPLLSMKGLRLIYERNKEKFL